MDDMQANVVLTADNAQYDATMQASATQTDALAKGIDDLVGKVGSITKTAGKFSLGIAAADVAMIGGATAAWANYEKQISQLNAQATILTKTQEDQRKVMRSYEEGIKDLRTEFGTSTREASALSGTISKLTDNERQVKSLTKTFQEMSMATGESSTGLADGVLSLSKIMGSSTHEVKGYSDQITELSANSRMSAQGIAQFAQQLAPVGRLIGQSQSDITGIATAFADAGQDGFRAASVYTRFVNDISYAMQTGSPRIAQYANLVGTTVEQFKALSGTEQVMQTFEAIERLGPKAITDLNRMGIEGTRTVQTIAGLSATGGLRQRVEEARGAQGSGAAAEGAEAATKGLTDEWQKLQQNTLRSLEAGGTLTGPLFEELLGGVNSLSEAFADLMEGPFGEFVQVIGGIVGAITGSAGALLLMAGAAFKLAAGFQAVRATPSQGFIEGLRGGSRITRDPETGIYGGAALGRRGAQVAEVAGERPGLRGMYNFGAAAGMGARRSAMRIGEAGEGVARAWADLRGREYAPGSGGGPMGMMGTMGAWGTRNLLTPQFDAMRHGDPTKRTAYWRNEGGLNNQQAERLVKSQDVVNRATEKYERIAKAHEDLSKRGGYSDTILARSAQEVEKAEGGLKNAKEREQVTKDRIAAEKESAKQSRENARAMRSSTTGLRGFGRELGRLGGAMAGGAFGAARAAGGGLMGAMGGPWGLGLTAAFMAPMAISYAKGQFGEQDESFADVRQMGGSQPYFAAGGITDVARANAGITAAGETRTNLGIAEARTISPGAVHQARASGYQLTNPDLKGLSKDDAKVYLSARYDELRNNPQAVQAIKMDLINTLGAKDAGEVINDLQNGNLPGIGRINWQSYDTGAATSPSSSSGMIGGVPGATTRQSVGIADPRQGHFIQRARGLRGEGAQEEVGNLISAQLAMIEEAAIAELGKTGQAGYERVRAEGLSSIMAGAQSGEWASEDVRDTWIKEMSKGVGFSLEDTEIRNTQRNLDEFNETVKESNRIWLERQGIDDPEEQRKFLRNNISQTGLDVVARQLFEQVQRGDVEGAQAAATSLGVDPIAAERIADDFGMVHRELLDIFSRQGGQFTDTVTPEGKIENQLGGWGRRYLADPLIDRARTEATEDPSAILAAQWAMAEQAGGDPAKLFARSSRMKGLFADPTSQDYIIAQGAMDVTRQQQALQAPYQTGAQRVTQEADLLTAMAKNAGDDPNALPQVMEQAFGLMENINQQAQQLYGFLQQQKQIGRSEEDFARQMEYAQEDYERQRSYAQTDFNMQRQFQEQDYQIQRQRAEENFARSRSRAQDDFHLQRERARESFGRMRSRAESNFDRQRQRAQENFGRQRARSEESFEISRRRSQENYDLQVSRSREDHNLQRYRQERDHQHQIRLMMEQSAKQMYDIYERVKVEGTNSATYLLTNSQDQTRRMREQAENLEKVRGMGLSDDAIQQMGFTSTENAQQLARFVSEIAQDPSLVKEFNQQVKKRIQAAAKLTTDESSTEWQEFVRQYNLARRRAQNDFERGLKRSRADFNRQMRQSRRDFNRQMRHSAQDFAISMAQSREDFDIQMRHSAVDFAISMSQSAEDFDIAMDRMREDFALQMEYSAEDYARMQERQHKQFALAMHRNQVAYNTSMDRMRENMNIQLARAQEDMDDAATAMSEGLDSILTRATNELDGKAQRQAKIIQRTFRGLKSGLRGTSVDIMRMLSQIFGFDYKPPKIQSSGTGSSPWGSGPAGFQEGTGFAGGGVLPGYTPGNDVHHYVHAQGGGPDLGFSGGEAIMRPEWTKAVGGPKAVEKMNHEAKYGGMQKFADGGIPAVGSWNQHTSGYPWAKWSGDINVPGPGDYGNPVRAYKDGVVAAAISMATSYGKHIKVNHPDSNERTLYAHLSSFNVSPGDRVRRGDLLGRVGSTGNSSGPHLHFEISGGSSPLQLGGGSSGSAQALMTLQDVIQDRYGKLENASAKVKMFDGLFEEGFWSDEVNERARRKWRQLVRRHGRPVDTANEGLDAFQEVSDGSAKDIVRTMMLQRWGAGQWPALEELVRRESSWNPQAANPTSSARGLFQKMTSIHGPVEKTVGGQARWGLNYIQGRYGTPRSALRFHDANNWYGDGAVFEGPETIGVGERGPEAVFPLDDRGADFMASLIERYSGGSMARGKNTVGDVPVVVHNNNSYSVDRSTNFTGAISVNANNPEEFVNQIQQRQRVMALSNPALGGKRF